MLAPRQPRTTSKPSSKTTSEHATAPVRDCNPDRGPDHRGRKPLPDGIKQNPSAPPCAQPRIPRGITHINVRHTTRFTVIGNYGEDVTIGDWTISTGNLPRYADKEKVKPEGTG